jgi:hypothetical protein
MVIVIGQGDNAIEGSIIYRRRRKKLKLNSNEEGVIARVVWTETAIVCCRTQDRRQKTEWVYKVETGQCLYS